VTLGSTAAAEIAGSVSVTAPLGGQGLHVDPYTGQVPVTLFGGVGVGGGYASVSIGFTGQTGIVANLTPLLPWNWR